MIDSTWKLLDGEFSRFPTLRGGEVPFDEIDGASDAIGISLPQDYRDFIHRYGSAMVGSFPIFGLRPVDAMGNQWSVIDTNRQYRDQQWAGVEGWLVVSADLSGNPIGIDKQGVVWLSDHDYGSIEKLAQTFEEFLLRHCLKAL